MFLDKLQQTNYTEVPVRSQNMGKNTIFWFLWHNRATKAQASLRICTNSPEPSLLAYTKFGYRLILRPKFRFLVPLDA